MKAELNPTVERLSDKIGGLTYRWMHGKKTLMKTPDMSKVKWSKAQKEHRARFRKAVTYARQAMADPKARAHYEKPAKKQTGFPSAWQSPITLWGRTCSKTSSLTNYTNRTLIRVIVCPLLPVRGTQNRA
jgi:hypothetical protein